MNFFISTFFIDPLQRLGAYLLFLTSLFTHRERFQLYVKRTIEECIIIGMDSIFIVSLVSIFIGAVTVIQTAANLLNPLIPRTTISLIARDMTLLELAPTFTCVVLAGKVGSSIAGDLGTMRITEQIDALEVMGINSKSYLVFPKVIAGLIMFPLLTITAAFLSIYGGYLAGVLTNVISPNEFVVGLRMEFNPNNVPFALLKSVVFSFLIITISAFQGYNTKGGALEVGQSSTAAVTNSCIAVLIFDFILAKLIL